MSSCKILIIRLQSITLQKPQYSVTCPNSLKLIMCNIFLLGKATLCQHQDYNTAIHYITKGRSESASVVIMQSRGQMQVRRSTFFFRYSTLITYEHLKYSSQMHKFCSRIAHPSHKILDTHNFLSGKLLTFRESRPASCWLTQDSRTSCTYYYTLCMAKHCRYLVATCNTKISGLNAFPSPLVSPPETDTLQILNNNWIIIILM